MLRHSLQRAWPVLLVAVLVVALAGCAARSAGTERFQVAGWAEAGVVKLRNTGNPVCYVSAPYNSGITFDIWRTSAGYRLYFTTPGWSLEENAVYPVSLSIDDLWWAQLDGVALDDAIVVTLGLDAEALSALRRGSLLTMMSEAETFQFELHREAATLDRLESCYRRHLAEDAAADYQNPFAAEQNPFKVHPRAEQASRSPVIMKPADLEQIFYKATGLEFRVETASEFTPSADLVYSLDDHLFGYYWEQSLEGRNLDTVFALTLAGMQEDCSGRAVSGRQPGRENDLAKIRRGFVSCEEGEFFADILILAKDVFAMVFVTSSSLEDAELAERVGAAVGGSFVP